MRCRADLTPGGVEWVLISVSPPGWRSRSGGSVRLAHLRLGSSSDQRLCEGPCRQEWLMAGEQVPAGSAGLRATSTRATLGRAACPADAGSAGSGRGSRVAGGVGGRLDQRPAQVVGAVVGQRAAMVTVAGLVDPWAQPGGAAPLLGRREPADVAALRRRSCSPAPRRSPGPSSTVGHRMVGAQAAQLPLAAGNPLVRVVDELHRGRPACPPTVPTPPTGQAAGGHRRRTGRWPHGLPNASKVACTRFLSAVWWR